jgi:hypothetical protein
VKGKGANRDDVALEHLDDDNLVAVQLVNDTTNVCFESSFTPSEFVTINDPARFKATAQ